jgi:16S rRNA processing protein RimM
MSKLYKKEPLLHIATLGKTVGIKGDMKLHVKSDFPEQFVDGASFLINKKEKITLRDVNIERGLVKINNITNPEDAKKFTNAKLFTTYEQTRKTCHLDKGEYFFFDLEDCEVFEDGKKTWRCL